MTNNSPFIFSRDSYSKVLNEIKNHEYKFIKTNDLQLNLNSSYRHKTCFLRHDIDVSMDFALEMAKLEHEHHVQSTYFVMLRSPMYNLMSRHSKKILEQILDFGHEIALHYDAGSFAFDGKKLEDDVCFEAEILAKIIGREIVIFSFHQPSQEVIDLQLSIPTLINTYNPKQMDNFKYISDSNRLWRENDIFSFLSQGFQNIHVLIHPIWWMCEELDTFDCWNRAIELNFLSSQFQLLETERAYGPARQLKII